MQNKGLIARGDLKYELCAVQGGNPMAVKVNGRGCKVPAVSIGPVHSETNVIIMPEVKLQPIE